MRDLSPDFPVRFVRQPVRACKVVSVRGEVLVTPQALKIDAEIQRQVKILMSKARSGFRGAMKQQALL